MSKERARLDMARKADELIIIALRKQVKELEYVLKWVKKDLLIRAEEDNDGFKVVNLSSSLWITLNDVIKEQEL
jgi:hypothetical protein